MKKKLLLLSFVVLFVSCERWKDMFDSNDQDYLIFGHFYGMCVGDNCVSTFKLTDTALFEDTLDNYAREKLAFQLLPAEKFELVKGLTSFFPAQLLEESDATFGCPDCADGGGLFIEYAQNGTVRSWRIDQMKANVPVYLHPFMEKVNEKIALLNQ